MPDEASQAEWYVYMVRCRGGMLYTGIACDVERRLREHQAGRGAKYLRGRGRLELVFRERVGTRRQALQLERAVKRLTKERRRRWRCRVAVCRPALGRAR